MRHRDKIIPILLVIFAIIKNRELLLKEQKDTQIMERLNEGI